MEIIIYYSDIVLCNNSLHCTCDTVYLNDKIVIENIS